MKFLLLGKEGESKEKEIPNERIMSIHHLTDQLSSVTVIGDEPGNWSVFLVEGNAEALKKKFNRRVEKHKQLLLG